MLLDDFLGIGMMIAFFHCVGASSEWWFPGGLPVLMLLTAFDISANMKSLVLMLTSIQPIHLIKRMKTVVHHFTCLLKKAMFCISLCSIFSFIEKFFGMISITGCVSFYTHLFNFVDFVIHKWYICWFSNISPCIVVFRITVILVFFACSSSLFN